jgi:hypothetical protein
MQAQVNRYDTPIKSEFVNDVLPLNVEQLLRIAEATKAAREKQEEPKDNNRTDRHTAAVLFKIDLKQWVNVNNKKWGIDSAVIAGIEAFIDKYVMNGYAKGLDYNDERQKEQSTNVTYAMLMAMTHWDDYLP